MPSTDKPAAKAAPIIDPADVPAINIDGNIVLGKHLEDADMSKTAQLSAARKCKTDASFYVSYNSLAHETHERHETKILLDQAERSHKDPYESHFSVFRVFRGQYLPIDFNSS